MRIEWSGERGKSRRGATTIAGTGKHTTRYIDSVWYTYTSIHTCTSTHTARSTHQEHISDTHQEELCSKVLPSPPFIFSPISPPPPTPHLHPTFTPHSPHSPRFKAAADDATIARALARGHMLVDENLLENPALRELQVIRGEEKKRRGSNIMFTLSWVCCSGVLFLFG